MRESPTFELLDRFQALRAEVSYHDPHVPEIGPTREHSKWQGVKSLAWSAENLRTQDCVVIATNHKAFDLAQLAEWAALIIDTRNAMTRFSGKALIIKA